MSGLKDTHAAPMRIGPRDIETMTTIKRAILAVFLLGGFTAASACDYPHRADVPDGTTATKEEMLNGQRGIKAYMAAMEEYLSCIEAKEQETVAGGSDLDESTRQQRIEMFNKKYNAAVEEMNVVAAEFNTQVRAYKERSQ